jgi:hypothetical protein
MVSRSITQQTAWRRPFPSLAAISWLLVISATTALGDLSLSPQKEEFLLDGVKMWHLAFETGLNQKATYQPPRGWLYSGSTNQLTLQPPGKNQTQVAITKTSLKEAVPLDEKSRKKLSAEALASLPQGSEQQKIQSEEANPLRISGNDTYLVQITYTFYGEKFSRYCLFLNHKSYQVRFQLTCRESDYKELSQDFQRSLYTWQNI